jgi:hypothetical protein
MNIRKFFLAVVLAAPLLAPVRAFNVTDGIYTFTANPGQPTGLDGSWVKFSGDQIVDWTMLDPVQAAANGWIVNHPVMMPVTFSNFRPHSANSKVVSLDTYPNGTGPDAFNFRIASPNTATSNEGSQIWYFSGQNNLNNFFRPLRRASPITIRSLSIQKGYWTRSAANVPDARAPAHCSSSVGRVHSFKATGSTLKYSVVHTRKASALEAFCFRRFVKSPSTP